MKSSIKSLFIATLMAAALTACGGGGGSGEPVSTDDQTPVLPDQAPQQPSNPQDPQVPQDPQGPLEPQEPEAQPLPIAGQTGWNLFGLLESRKPLEMLKTLLCSQLAASYEEPAPQSSEECDTRFPGLQSGNEESLPMLQDIPSGTELVKREGCTYVPAEQALACSWTYVGPHPESPTGFIKAYVAMPFTPSFGLEVENCAADKPHYFPDGLARGPARGSSQVGKDLAYPMGCVAWGDIATFFSHVEADVEFDEYQPE